MDNKSKHLLEKIQSRIGGRLYDHYLLASCPNPDHDDKSPSFFVYPDYYSCKACGYSGKPENLLDRIDGRYIHRNKRSLFKNPFQKWEKERSLFETLKLGYRVGKQFPGQMDYLVKRKITLETIQDAKIGWLEGWITIPLISPQKKLIGAIARNTRPSDVRYVSPRGQDPRLLYAPCWQSVLESDHVYLVFGMIDALTLCQSGKPVITTTSGTTISPQPFEHILKRIIVVPDHGEEEVGARLVANLGWRGTLFTPDYPFDTKDINDLLVKGYEHELVGY